MRTADIGRTIEPPRPEEPPVRSDVARPAEGTPRPFRIAHLSDPHLSRQYYREHIKSLKILLRAILEEGVDHIVISGDIISTADANDFYLAREVFSTFGILQSDRLTVVPGNHDIFGGPHRAVDVLSFPTHIRTVDYRRHHELFRDVFGETFEGAVTAGSNDPYPFVKRVGPISLIGLNSIPPWSLRSNLLGTNGIVDDAQCQTLVDMHQQGLWKDSHPVAVMHHHFHDLTDDAPSNGFWKRVETRTMRLRRRRRLIRLFKEIGVDTVMHGHIHRNEVYERQGIAMLNGAGSVCDDPVRFLKYNMLTEDRGSMSATVHTLSVPYQQTTVNLELRRRRDLVRPAALVSTGGG